MRFSDADAPYSYTFLLCGDRVNYYFMRNKP